MRPGRTTATLVLAALLVVSCGGESDEDVASDPVESPGRAPADDTAGGRDEPAGDDQEVPMTGEDPQTFAVADAAQRAGVDPADVTVVAQEQVTWPDGSLGCPQPDQFYTQALVEGYRVVVEVNGERMHYHGQTGQLPTYCASPSEPAAGDGVADR